MRNAPSRAHPLTAHQKCALAGWAVSLVVSSVWIRLIVGCPVWPDVASSVASHLVALSVLWLDPRLLPPLGCALMGVCVGLMFVDMAFDLVIIREGSVRLGPTTVTPGRCAWPGAHSGRYRSRVQRPAYDSAHGGLDLASHELAAAAFAYRCMHVRVHACIVQGFWCSSSSARPAYLFRALSSLTTQPALCACAMPTLRLQAGGAPLLQHDAQRAACQHGHVRLSTTPKYMATYM